MLIVLCMTFAGQTVLVTNKKFVFSLQTAFFAADSNRVLQENEDSTRVLQENDFFNNLTNNLARGMNIWTPISGCNVASKVYWSDQKRFQDCQDDISSDRILDDSLVGLSPYDTVYMYNKRVGDFVEKALHNLTVPIVLLTGQYELRRKPHHIPNRFVESIANHPNIIKWFVHSPTFTVPDHFNCSKIAPLPYGIQPTNYNPLPHRPAPVDYFRQALAVHATLPEKRTGVFVGFLANWTNPDRNSMPRGPHLPLPEYYERMARSQFVLSPSGDRPECYRHYEALGLGAIPVTDLPGRFYSHLADGPIVYNNSDWYLDASDALALLGKSSFPAVNRNLVFVEYWLSYIDKTVGRDLPWSDTKSNNVTLLKNFVLDYDGISSLLSSLRQEAQEARKQASSPN